MALFYFQRQKDAVTEVVMLTRNVKVVVAKSSSGISAKYKVLKDGHQQVKQLSKLYAYASHEQFYPLYNEYCAAIQKHAAIMPHEQIVVTHGKRV